jgi:SAM-dependent MidA family methyltransferase
MIDKQKKKLSNILNVQIRWSSFEELAGKPVIGVILAHEVLDALPVERVVLQNKKLFRQGVALDKFNSTLYYNELPLTKNIEDHLLEYEREIGIKIPPEGASNGWSSEIHIEKNSWLKKASESLVYGALLIIDYALESNRYYNHLKNNGTIIAYKKQSATSNLLCEPGFFDLTTHLCIEALIFFAKKNKWQYLGSLKQGEALLSLGLALRLYSLQKLPSNRLDVALQRREALLRLVDPYGLGGFRWFAFEIDNSIGCVQQDPTLNSMFLIAPSE